MVKKLLLIFSFVFWLSLNVSAQTVILSDEFDNGDGKWNTGWIEGSTNVTFSIDTNSVLSGKNSYLADIVSASATTYFIQRNADAPLKAGNEYTLSFKAVTDKEGASINVLFEIAGDPYTKRLNVIQEIATTPQVYTYTVSATEDVPTNQVKLHYGGTQNDNAKIWIDSVIVTEAADPALVSKWGRTTDGFGDAWPHGVLNDESTLPGDGGVAGEQPMSTGNGMSLRGGFDSLKVSTEQAVVVSGQLEYVGGMGNVYTPLRYAITYQDSVTLMYQNTDSAQWVSSKSHYGYEFTPRSGTGTQPNGGGGVGSVWTIINGNWASTYSNGGGPIGPVVNQAPRNAEIAAGTYDFAISIQAIDDTTNEVRWSLVKTDNSYWFAGTVIDTAVTDKVNGIAFWFKDGEVTQFNVSGVRAELGDPIDIPPAPFAAYYLDQWGRTTDGFGDAWPHGVLNDESTLAGNAGVAGEQPMSTGNGMSLRGGFGQDVSIPSDEAVVVWGQIEYVGGMGNVYTPLRYAITYQDSSELMYQYTDSAQWVSPKSHYGYEFTPRSGTGTQPNGGGGVGSVWTIINGNWASTYSNGGGPVGPVVNQAPRNAEISSGTYNFAISIQAIDDTTNEVRWSLVKTDNSYWFAGSVTDTAVTDKVNGIAFWFKDGEVTQFNVIDAQIDKTAPIEIPPAPWEDYYVDTWGIIDGGGGWDFVPGEVTGNAGLVGDAVNTGWSGLRGQFDPRTLVAGEYFIVEGSVTFDNGGFDASNSFRFGMFNGDAGTADSVWSGDGDGHSGYLFLPQSGAPDGVEWAGSDPGSWGAVHNTNWMEPAGASNYSLGTQVQTPANAVAEAGKYDFMIQVGVMEDGSNQIAFVLENNDYSWRGVGTDDTDPVQTLNSIAFALGTGNTTTAMHLTDVQLKLREDPQVSVGDAFGSKLLPKKFGLRNYPNPFNPTTTIEIALPQNSKVNLVIYDLMGREVTQLIKDAEYNAGWHQVTFDAANLASGLYFYRLEAGDHVLVKKLMLIK